MTRAAVGVCVLLLAAACPAAAGRNGPVVSLSASPARVTLAGTERASITLRNYGPSRLVVGASTGGVALDVRGRPKLLRRTAGRRSAASWLNVRPRELTIRAGGTAVVEVASRVPSRAEPGDHHAVLLLATRATQTRGVGVRMRLGVRVIVRAPGPIVRRLVVRGLRVRPTGAVRVLEVELANRGNVTEVLPRGRLTVSLLVRGRPAVRLRPGARELLPGSAAIVAARYAGALRGTVLARVDVLGAPSRTFRVRL